MNYYAARQKLNERGEPAGVWHYTCENSGRIRPVGKCADGCPGHPSAEEAQAHYREHLLDTASFHGPKVQEWPKEKCSLPDCNAEAKFCASTGPGRLQNFALCEAHANRQGLDRVLGKVGESWSSY